MTGYNIILKNLTITGSIISLSGSQSFLGSMGTGYTGNFTIFNQEPINHFQFLPEWLKTAYNHDAPIHIIIENCLKNNKTKEEIIEDVCAYLFKIHRLKAEMKNGLPM